MSLPSVVEARAAMLAQVAPLGAETVDLVAANRRFLREAIHASRDQPPFDASAMDGWAVRRADALDHAASLAIVGESAAGHGWVGTLAAGEAVRISTGAPLPDGADWVVMQEQAERDGDRVRLGPLGESPAFVRPAGADFRCGEMLLDAGTRLNPSRIALVAAAGVQRVKVTARPRIAIVATGDEIAPPGATPSRWQIHDSAGPALAAWFAERGCDVATLAPLPDDQAEVARVLGGVVCDLLVTIGGASVGDHDLVKPALASFGLDPIVDGVAVRPGKPTWFGVLPDRRLVLGLPGNPVSAIVCAWLFATDIVAALEGVSAKRSIIQATLQLAIAANGDREHYMRASLDRDEAGHWLASPSPNQDSSLVSVLASAGGLMCRAPNAPMLQAGATVTVHLLDESSLALA